MKKTALTFGLLSGSIIIVYSVITFIIFGDFSNITPENLKTVEMMGFLRYIILLLTVIFAIRHFKKQNGGTGSFKQLFLAGLYTALIVAILVGLMEMFYMMANPGFMEQYGTLKTQTMQKTGASAEEIAKFKSEMESMKWMASPAAMGIFYCLETAVIGAVLSAIVALIKRTKNKMHHQPAL